MLPWLVLLALGVFVVWGAMTRPTRPFSWGMYSGSTKGFLWTEEAGGVRRILRYEQLRLTPDGHVLSVEELRRLIESTPPSIPFEGLIIGSGGHWSVAYEPGSRRLVTTRLAEGSELAHLATALRRLSEG
ncbi:hypothetical protein [Cystobacter ferrugineus]|uniref:Uncharacterized protein n=1 Tax=Cystobacter ferrugineus TaxID=83449 RepID=A0A1L9B0Z9_9BACT|nr:hypothetical protein [Cystobacter ferrugineus]OJH35934.1 hypothetical protein BON30_35565 [Cystobacter ferrugineus]